MQVSPDHDLRLPRLWPLQLLLLVSLATLTIAWRSNELIGASGESSMSCYSNSTANCSLPRGAAVFVQRKAVLLSNRSTRFDGHPDYMVLLSAMANNSYAWIHVSAAWLHNLWGGAGWKPSFLQLHKTSAGVLAAVESAFMASSKRMNPMAIIMVLMASAIAATVFMALYLRLEPRFGPRQELPHEASLRLEQHPGSGSSHLQQASPCASPSQTRQRWLCPSLVVPSRMELVFAVSEVLRSEKQQLGFKILDLQGQPLCRVIVDEFGSRCGIFLRSLDDRPLAWVWTGQLHEKGHGSPEICWPSGEVYGHVTMEDPVPCKRYTLRDSAGQRVLTFHGNFHEKAINVVNSSGRLVCDTERSGVNFRDGNSYYQVRVAPGVDAGLILCGLFAVDKLN